MDALLNECEGCYSYENKFGGCASLLSEYEVGHADCPCRQCIVKLTCQDECDDFDQFGFLMGKELFFKLPAYWLREKVGKKSTK